MALPPFSESRLTLAHPPLESRMLPLTTRHASHHQASTAINPLLPPLGDVLRVGSRRWFLQTGLAGLAGLSLADTLRLRAATSGGTGRQRDPHRSDAQGEAEHDFRG